VWARLLVIFRVSSIDLVQGGLIAEEIAAEARRVEAAGATSSSQGIGWHEAPCAHHRPEGAARDLAFACGGG